MNDRTLKPCPFCGSDAAKITHDHGTYEPGCTHCGTYIGQYSSERSAIAAWNLRPEAALQQQEEPREAVLGEGGHQG